MKLRDAILCGLALAVLGVAALLLLRTGSTPPPGVLPNPNGYNDFLAAAVMLDPQTGTVEKRDEALLVSVNASNGPALARARLGLRRDCMVPPVAVPGTNRESSMQVHMDRLGKFKQLGIAFTWEADALVLSGRTNEAALAAVDAVIFGAKLGHRGPIIDQLVGVAVRSIGLRSWSRLAPEVDAATLATVASALETCLTNRVSPAVVEQDEANWAAANFGPTERLMGRLARVLGAGDSTAIVRAHGKIGPSWRQLADAMLAAACDAYAKDHGSWPTSVTNLVPRYLKTVVLDPDSGLPMPLPPSR